MFSLPKLGLLSTAAFVTASAIASFASVEKTRDLPDASRQELLEVLGEQLFHDKSLSVNGTQSCATCHDPAYAFTDPRENKTGKAVSLGFDDESLGTRNTPTVMYAMLSPDFHFNEKTERHRGGQFWDGRASDLKQQAGQPMLNPVEMGMPDQAAVAERVRANPTYTEGFARIYGAEKLSDDDLIMDYATAALAAYQSMPEFAPFDSKFDRWRRGEAELTAQEEFGYTVFVTWNCRLCHQLQRQGVTDREPFTSFEYHNIGVPANPDLVAHHGAEFVDLGLAQQAGMDESGDAGKFKVPTLRNVAVTGPYMHNGVFEDLRTAVAFYNKYPSQRPIMHINPETGENWGEAEVAENLSLRELESGLEVNDERIDALVAFLETLTDKRYEPLLEQRRAEQEAAKTARMEE